MAWKHCREPSRRVWAIRCCWKPASRACATARPTENRGLRSISHDRIIAKLWRPAPSSSPLQRMPRRKFLTGLSDRFPAAVFANRIRASGGGVRLLSPRSDSAAARRIRFPRPTRRRTARPRHGLQFISFRRARAGRNGLLHQLCGRRHGSQALRNRAKKKSRKRSAPKSRASWASRGRQSMTNVHRYARALPQYNLGHSEIVKSLARRSPRQCPDCFWREIILSGPSIGSCVEQANRTADAARVYLASIGVAGVGAVAHA